MTPYTQRHIRQNTDSVLTIAAGKFKFDYK
jgi:hypothetical protein